MAIRAHQTRPQLTDYQIFLLRHRQFEAGILCEIRRCNSLLQQLGTLDRRAQRGRIRKLLGDRRLHQVFAFGALRASGRLRDATPRTVAVLAEQFDAFAPITDEPFHVRAVSKGSGVRTVHNFGPRRRMQQTMVSRILRHIHPPLDSQKLFRGGMPMARKAIEDAAQRGLVYGTEVDFVGFYSSIRPDALHALLRPLPTSVVDAVVWDVAARSSYNRGAVPSHGVLPSNSLEGLSLGSATSPIVGETVITALLGAARLSHVITFADNLFVLGRTTEEVSAKIQTLRDVVACHTFGELEVRGGESGIFALAGHFEFAKQEGVLREGQIAWSPGSQKLAQYQVSELDHLTLEQILIAESRVRNWRRAYPTWHRGSAFEAEYLAALAVRRFYLGNDAADLNKAVVAVFHAFNEQIEVEPNFAGGLQWFVPEAGDASGQKYRALIARLNLTMSSLARAA